MVCLSEDTFKVCYLIDNEQEMRRDCERKGGEVKKLPAKVLPYAIDGLEIFYL